MAKMVSSITLNPEIQALAKKLGINVSAAAEDAIKQRASEKMSNDKEIDGKIEQYLKERLAEGEYKPKCADGICRAIFNRFGVAIRPIELRNRIDRLRGVRNDANKLS